MQQILLILPVILFLTSCEQTLKKSKDTTAQIQTDTLSKTTWEPLKRQSKLPDSLTKIEGDFNGDGKGDSAIVIPPYQDENGWCEQCIAKIAFTSSVDSITLYEVNGAMLFNVGDLDGDKSDELLLIPDWPNSCLGTQLVYTYKDKKWDTIASGEMFRCSPQNTIRKIRNGLFAMTESDASNSWETIIKMK